MGNRRHSSVADARVERWAGYVDTALWWAIFWTIGLFVGLCF